ncbi:MAG: hypothetical protein K2N91_04745 [Muribaculaceae bacterium]|nr:hypothetical protein [Muribaculaceae bacterium]
MDSYAVTPEEVDAANATIGKKKEKKGLGMLKSVAGAATGTSQIIGEVDTVDTNMAAVLQKYFDQQGVAARMVGKWFGYNMNGDNKYDDEGTLIVERGGYAARKQDLINSNTSANKMAAFSALGEQMIPKTFVLAINLRYRSIKEIVEEATAAASAAASMFGGYGQLAGAALSAGTKLANVDGYSVQAVAYLYQLEWDPEIEANFYEYWDKPIEDLIASGICKVKFVGKTKDRSNVGSVGKSNKGTEHIQRAVARAIDKTIVKLQKEYEDFRTNAPITKVENGYVYAEIGMKEGLVKGDKYDILEKQEDEKGNVTYKKVGSVEPDPNMIWDNRYGAFDTIDSDDKDEAGNADAIKLGASAFKCKSKNVYPGMFLRLAKKK